MGVVPSGCISTRSTSSLVLLAYACPSLATAFVGAAASVLGLDLATRMPARMRTTRSVAVCTGRFNVDAVVQTGCRLSTTVGSGPVSATRRAASVAASRGSVTAGSKRLAGRPAPVPGNDVDCLRLLMPSLRSTPLSRLKRCQSSPGSTPSSGLPSASGPCACSPTAARLLKVR